MIGFESDRDPVPEKKNRINQLDWITVRMGSQSDPIDLTKMRLYSLIFLFSFLFVAYAFTLLFAVHVIKVYLFFSLSSVVFVMVCLPRQCPGTASKMCNFSACKGQGSSFIVQ